MIDTVACSFFHVYLLTNDLQLLILLAMRRWFWLEEVDRVAIAQVRLCRSLQPWFVLQPPFKVKINLDSILQSYTETTTTPLSQVSGGGGAGGVITRQEAVIGDGLYVSMKELLFVY